MTISRIVRFTGADVQWVLKGAAYINDNTDATVTVKRYMSGDPASIIAVEEWDSLAAYEAGWQKLRDDPAWQAIFNEASAIVYQITFLSHEGP